MNIKDDILLHIEKLPPLPKTVEELKNVYDEERSSAGDLEEIIEKDPILVADILKVANSPYYGFSHEIHDLRHAIVLFGFDEIVNFAVFSVMEKNFDFDMQPYSINDRDFLNFSISKSRLSKKFFKNDKKNSSILRSSAFLSDVGKIVIAKYANENGIKIVNEDLSLKNIDFIEKELFGLDTIEISCYIFEKWNFDKKFIDVIYFSKKCSENEISNILNSIRSIVSIKSNILDLENIECIDKELLANAI